MSDTSTKAILIREVHEDELRVMKASAALSGLSLQAWCLGVLRDRLQQQAQQGGGFNLVVTPAASTPEAPAAKS